MSKSGDRRSLFSVIGKWLGRGWRDFRQAMLLNMGYAGLFLVLGVIASVGLGSGGFSLVYFIVAGGFLIVVPVLVTVYYQLAEKLRAGDQLAWGDIAAGLRGCPVAVLVIGLVSLVIYLIWVTDALIIYSVYFDFVPMSLAQYQVDPELFQDAKAFILFASILGMVLSFIIFCVTVLSIPFALEHRTGLVDAVTFSVRAVFRHPRLMFTWALVIGGATFATVLLALPLLLVVLPVLAYANYDTYSDMQALHPVEPD